MRASCKGCIHYRLITYTEFACHHLIDTGYKRPCPVDKCTAKKKSGYILFTGQDGKEKYRFKKA